MSKSSIEEEVCQVCFTTYPFQTHLQYKQRIFCSECQLSAHRFCYSPSISGKTFVCDSCQDGELEPICFICKHKKGFLKKVENKFFHLICLFFNSNSIISSYKNLHFERIELDLNLTKNTCEVCKKQAKTLIKCSQPGCKRYIHAFCLLNRFGFFPDDVEEGWKHNIGQLNKGNSNLKAFYQKFRKYLQLHHSDIAKLIHFPPPKETKSMFSIYCPKHKKEQDCYCGLKNELSMWVQCDTCKLWAHIQCEEKKVRGLINLKTKYKCTCCYNWEKHIVYGEKFPIQEQYQHFYLYDFIYVQTISEQKNYLLNCANFHLFEKLPILPSHKFCQYFLRSYVWPFIKKKNNISQILSLKQNKDYNLAVQLMNFLLSDRLPFNQLKKFPSPIQIEDMKESFAKIYMKSKDDSESQTFHISIQTSVDFSAEFTNKPSLVQAKQYPDDIVTVEPNKNSERREKLLQIYHEIKVIKQKEVRKQKINVFLDLYECSEEKVKRSCFMFKRYLEEIQYVREPEPKVYVESLKKLAQNRMINESLTKNDEKSIQFLKKTQLKVLVEAVQQLKESFQTNQEEGIIQFLSQVPILCEEIDPFVHFFHQIRTISFSRYPRLEQVLDRVGRGVLRAKVEEKIANAKQYEVFRFIYKSLNVKCRWLVEEMQKNDYLDSILKNIETKEIGKTVQNAKDSQEKIKIAFFYAHQERLDYRFAELHQYKLWYSLYNKACQVIPHSYIKKADNYPYKKIDFELLEQLDKEMREVEFPTCFLKGVIEGLLKKGAKELQPLHEFMKAFEEDLKKGQANKKHQKKEMELINTQLKISEYDFGKQKREFDEIFSINFEDQVKECENQVEVLDQLPVDDQSLKTEQI